MEGITLAIVLLVLGMAAIFLEAFIPSGGLISVGAVASLIAAVVVAFTQSGATSGVVFLILALLLSPVCLVLAFMLLPKTPIGKRLMLAESQTKEAGFEPQGEKDRDLVGKEGVSLSTLRPSGEARIDGRRYDVVTEGDLIEPQTKIVVHKADGNRIVVRRAEPEADP